MPDKQVEGDVPYGEVPLFDYQVRSRADANPNESEILNAPNSEKKPLNSCSNIIFY